MYLCTEHGRKMYLIRITSYDAYFADAVRFPGRGVHRDGKWQFPPEGMTKHCRHTYTPEETTRRDKQQFFSLSICYTLCLFC
jgi:hypothetical protein